MELISIVVGIFGATGFWKVVEMLIDRKKNRAEVSNLYTQVNSQIITNWVSWAQKLEERVKELEGCNADMLDTIETQRNRIQELEKQVSVLEEQNTTLKNRLEELNNQTQQNANG